MTLLFLKYSTNTDIYIRMITHPYEHMYTHPILMNNFKKLSRLILRFMKSIIKEHLTVDGDITFH
jgi:hypothetical protein